jgi:hypothetical protein
MSKLARRRPAEAYCAVRARRSAYCGFQPRNFCALAPPTSFWRGLFLPSKPTPKPELIPVAFAARMLYEQAYGASPPDAHLIDRLNGLAYWLARYGEVYATDARRAAPRRLSPEDIARGHFRHGGSELHFLDERAPIVQLAVTRECIENAVKGLLCASAGKVAAVHAQEREERGDGERTDE